MSSEFSIIERYFDRQAKQGRGVVLGIGDDCALLELPAGHQLAVSIDTLIEGVHFPVTTTPFDIGYKTLAVSLSDLAAMGAEPAWATLSLSIPHADSLWLEAFSDGFFQLADQHNVALVGGDTVRGPLAITAQLHGFVPKGAALRRGAAQVGDLICVSGVVGDGALGLKLALGSGLISSPIGKFVEPSSSNNANSNPLNKLNRPTPQVELGLALRGIANACIDISDGLAADLGHILKASGVGASLRLAELPLSAAVQCCSSEEQLQMALFGGDDYELCFTLPAAKLPELMTVVKQQSLPTVTVIGLIEAQSGLRMLNDMGVEGALNGAGFDHFGANHG